MKYASISISYREWDHVCPNLKGVNNLLPWTNQSSIIDQSQVLEQKLAHP